MLIHHVSGSKFLHARQVILIFHYVLYNIENLVSNFWQPKQNWCHEDSLITRVSLSYVVQESVMLPLSLILMLQCHSGFRGSRLLPTA